jgi:hypothetical protein
MTSYCTTTELKNAMNKTTAGDDTVLAAIISAVSGSIDSFCNRPDGFVAEASDYESTRYYFGTGKAYQWIDENVDVVGVYVKDSNTDEENEYVTWAVGDIGVTLAADVFPASGDPLRPDFVTMPYTLLVCGPNGDYSIFTKSTITPTVKVTARWGYAATCPAQIKQATIMQSSRWYKLVQGAMARAMASNEVGGAMTYPGQLDPDVKFILTSGRFIKPVVGRR